MSNKNEYENHECSDWLERESRWPKESLANAWLFDTVNSDWLEKERKWVEKAVGDTGYFDSGDDRMGIVHLGRYRPFFEAVKTSLERKATVHDYHIIYKWILDNITTDILADSLLCWMDGRMDTMRQPESFKDIIVAFDRERKKLDDLFSEYTAEVEETRMEEIGETTKEILKIVQATNKMQPLPEWRTQLRDKGFLHDDGMRVIEGKLQLAVAEYVNHTKQPVTSKFILENFLKEDGTKYSSSSCNQARDYANTKK